MFVGGSWIHRCGDKAHLLSSADAATVQRVDVLAAFVHEAADEPEVAEDYGGHLGDVLVALPLTDVATVIHQAGHQVALALLLLCAFFDLQGWAHQKKYLHNTVQYPNLLQSQKTHQPFKAWLLCGHGE